MSGLVLIEMDSVCVRFSFYPRVQASRVIGEQAKRARRYLVMFMETRDIYIYICTSVSNTHVRVNVILRIKFKS